MQTIEQADDTQAAPTAVTAPAKKIKRLLILVSALGYFVDVYDMMLFTVVRKKSLLELGVPDVDTLCINSYCFY